MNYKRLEIYVGWTCNQKCNYCIEMPNMLEAWNKKVTKLDIFKKLFIFKKFGFNHVTYLGGEPFIQPVFYDALKLGKKLGYTILVTTNASTLHIDSQAKKFLPFIDQLILSFQAIDKNLQKKISQVNTYVRWNKVFKNISKYWNGSMLKTNIVITNDNKKYIFDFIKYLNKNGIKEIAITYPDLSLDFGYNLMKKIAPTYKESFKDIPEIFNYCKLNNIILKIPDFPFCIFPKDSIYEYIKLTDDYSYQERVKVRHTEEVDDRGNIKEIDELPRERFYVYKCNICKFKGKCWGPSIHYEKIYGLKEINPIL